MRLLLILLLLNSKYVFLPPLFAAKLAKRIVSKTYVDFGQGILKYMQNIYEQLNSQRAYERFITKEKK